MTDEQLFKIIKKHLPKNLAYRQDGGLLDPCKIEGTLGDVLDFVKAIYEDDYFYKTRCELLQKVHKYMRDPERQIVCDILANNSLLPDPSGVRYGQDLMKLIGTYD